MSIDAINGDMGWTTSCERRKINMVRFWNRLMSLNNTQLPKVILNWDSKCRGNTWSLNIQNIFNEIDQENVVASNLQVSINKWSALFHEIQCNQWSVIIARNPKLRTYVTFKDTYEVEPYALSFMNRKHTGRSYLAQYRCGILPLEIETGRWQNKPVEERIC